MIKKRTIILLILLLLAIDQTIKIYVKTNFYYGEEYYVFGQDWFRLHFLENSGMAWGFKFGDGYLAKVVLILFRLAAIIWGTFYINKMIKKGGEHFTFFDPVFNTADVWISTGVLLLLVFHKKHHKTKKLE